MSQESALGAASIVTGRPPAPPVSLALVPPPPTTEPAKAVFDRLAAVVALVLTVPLLVALALVIRLTSQGPALYRQERVGLGGRRFRMWKLRTMQVDADEHRAHLSEALGRPLLFKMVDDPRITRVGRFLRRWSLDELPQLWNVVKGDMSLVGPRPGMPDEVAVYRDDLSRRFAVKPGMTGLWQVSGRSALPWEESVRLDLDYVDNWSLALDVRTLLRTVAAVVRGEGAY